MVQACPDSDVREATLFRDVRGQALRIPPGFELPGTRVFIRKDGARLIIEPQAKSDLIEVLRTLSPIGVEDDFAIDNDATLAPLKPIDL
jgi:antitoxin VapB